MAADESFADLMDRLRRRDPQAAELIYQQFARRLVGLARSRLDTLLRSKEDPEDVVQSVFRMFFSGHAEGQFDLENWNSLWNLLMVITLRKCGHRVEYFRAACRDVGREVSGPADAEAEASWLGLAREPSPAEAAMLAETVEGLMKGLEGRDRKILEMSLQGETVPAISSLLSCSERTVTRVQERIRKQLERARGNDDDS